MALKLELEKPQRMNSLAARGIILITLWGALHCYTILIYLLGHNYELKFEFFDVCLGLQKLEPRKTDKG